MPQWRQCGRLEIMKPRMSNLLRKLIDVERNPPSEARNFLGMSDVTWRRSESF